MANPVSVYPNSYGGARTEFLQALWELKKTGVVFEHEEYKVDSTKHPELYVDSVYVAPLKIQKRLFIITSGIHGAEAPLGSALQVKFLRHILPYLNRDEDGILIIHSLNPYGFYTGRRVTESNVDLNRNFLLNAESFKKQSNTAYDEYRSLFSSEKRIESVLWERIKLYFSFIGAAFKGNTEKQKITRAFAQGQYSDPRGIYYGGKKYEPQVLWLDKLLNKKLRGYAQVLQFDIHTGLGKASELQLISSLDTDLNSPHLAEFKESLSKEEGIRIVSPRSDGFYITSGDLIDYVYAKAVKLGLKAATFTAEFGTLGDDIWSKLKTSTRIVLENRAHHWDCESGVDKSFLKKDFLELFNPSDKDWREQVLDIGTRAFLATLSMKEDQSALKKAE